MELGDFSVFVIAHRSSAMLVPTLQARMTKSQTQQDRIPKHPELLPTQIRSPLSPSQ